MITENTLKAFQQDLKNGLSIAEACTKHNISFSDAFWNIKHPSKPIKIKKPIPDPRMQYITKHKNTYYVRKHVNKKYVAFGSYNSLEDAIKIREHCKKYGWDKSRLDKYCRELGIKRVYKKRGRY